ncbi:MAG: GtrA family protein, partial [Thaumarchaeota archaeon]|nr:GtrA family protein [Nitrososphaerota archaeon]
LDYGHMKAHWASKIGAVTKAARFFTVGASGLVINLSVIALLTETVSLNYLFANSIGILTSMTNNFLLNKVWTFQDRRFERVYVLKQYGKFVSFSSGGAILQLTLIYYFVDLHHLSYYPALIMAVMIAAFGNFILNKRFTFGEKIWS